MKPIFIVLLTACLAQWAAGARLLRGGPELPPIDLPTQPATGPQVPLIYGAPQPLQETYEYDRLSRGGADGLLSNRVQADAMAGRTDSFNTVILQTRQTGLLDTDTRQSIGQNQAQSIVSGAVDNDALGQAITKANFGALQYQVYGNGLRANAETTTALASNDAQRAVLAGVETGDASIATRGNADAAFATTQQTSHKFTD